MPSVWYILYQTNYSKPKEIFAGLLRLLYPPDFHFIAENFINTFALFAEGTSVAGGVCFFAIRKETMEIKDIFVAISSI